MVSEIFTEILNELKNVNIWIRIGLSAVFLVILIVLSLWQNTNLEGKLLWSFFRGFIQIIVFGAFLTLIFELERLWILYLILLGMCLFAAFTNYRTYPYPKIFIINFMAITITSLVIMSFVIATSYITLIPGASFEGIIPEAIGEYIIPMGSMVIAFAMRESGIALERAKSDIVKLKGKIEAALALGDSPGHAIQSTLRDSYRASLTPTINRVAVLGIVTIPGLMAGMIIGGATPIEAAIYQIVIFLLLLVAAFITSIITNNLFMKQFFTEEQQFDLQFLNNIKEIEKQKADFSFKKAWKKIKEKLQKNKKTEDQTG